MATILPTRLHLLLPMIQQRLMDVLGFPAERVLISCRQEEDGEDHPQGLQYVRMRALGASPDMPVWEGAERVCPEHTRKLRVTLYTRLNTDPLGDDGVWATDPSLGHYAAEHLLYEALYAWFPTDTSGNAFTFEGLRPAPVQETRKDRANRSFDGWGRSSVECDIRYVLDITKGLNNP